MTTVSFDPWREQTRLAWRNRVARWRRDAAQSLFHGVVLALLGALVLVPTVANGDAFGAALLQAGQRWPWPIALALFLAFAARQAQAWHRQAQARSRDWLAALPIPARVRQRARIRAARNEAMRQMFVLALAWVAIATSGQDATPWHADGDGSTHWLAVVAGFGCVLLAALCAPLGARLLAARARARVAARVSSVIADRGDGRIWRWQRLACGVALHGRTLAWGALAWLLVPMDGGLGALFVMGAAGIGTALLSGAWRRSLAVLPQAQAWLAAQPIARDGLLRAGWFVPATVLAAGAGAVAVLASVLARPTLGLMAAAVVAALGALQFAATAAFRAAPSRIALASTVHLALFVGVLQGFPLAALPLWIGQMIVLLRRARA